MKYSKEFHEYWKQLCNAIEIQTAKFPTLDTVETLLTEIERLQEVETHLTKNIHVLMQLIECSQSERGWPQELARHGLVVPADLLFRESEEEK